MASLSGIRAGQAFIEIFADDRRLIRTLENASKRLKAWGQSINVTGQKIFATGLAALGGLVGASKVFASMGDAVQKMSARTGISAEVLSELDFAASQSGTDIETLESSLHKMQRLIVNAADGSQQAIDAFNNLGLSIQNLISLSPDEQFKLIADRIAQIKDPTLQAATAMDVFGRSGTQLLPLLQGGAAGIEDLQRQARELGLTISTEDANAAAALGDALDVLWRTVKQGIFIIGSALAPALKEAAKAIANIIVKATKWIKENKGLIIALAAIAAGAIAGGIALMALGTILWSVGIVFGTLAGVISLIAGGLSMLLTPAGLVGTAIVTLAGYFLYASAKGKEALSWLGEQFKILREEVVAAWKGISDALAAGDIGLAAKILWLTLKMEWQKGINWLTEKWIDFKESIMAVWTEATYGLAKILTSAWAGLQTAWVEAIAFMSETWSTFTNHVVTGWRTAQNWIAKKFVQLMALFDKSVDAEAAMQILDEDFAREQKARDETTRKQLADIERTRQAKRKAIDEEEKGTLDILDEQRQQQHVMRREKYDADLKAAQDALEETRRQWNEAIESAAKKRKEVETAGGGPKGLADQFEDMLDSMKKSTSAVGTFNPAALWGLGGGGALERTARATEETAKNTRRIEQRIERNNPVFTP